MKTLARSEHTPGMARPPSATRAWIAGTGLVAYLVGVAYVCSARPFGNDLPDSALLLVLLTAAAIGLVDLIWGKSYRSPSAGLDRATPDPSWRRTLTKFVGLVATLLTLIGLYWLFPEYHDTFYSSYYVLLARLLVAWLALAIPYFYFVDRRMVEPKDGYWHAGRVVLLAWRDVDPRILGQYALGWLIKGFFLPLMFGFMCNDLGRLFATQPGALHSFAEWFDWLLNFLFFIDVGLVTMGYLVSLRLTDTHLRSAEPTMLGWVVALVCYNPFWPFFAQKYLAYDTGIGWGTWLAGHPVAHVVWGSTILLLTTIFVWATVSFGARFSNLTHRGIITSGPYRYSKHPAYVAKSLSWWLMSVPFIATDSATEAIRRCILLALLNVIYLLRARTEERHLARDPDYVAYAVWIETHGILRAFRLTRWQRHGSGTAPGSGA